MMMMINGHILQLG